LRTRRGSPAWATTATACAGSTRTATTRARAGSTGPTTTVTAARTTWTATATAITTATRSTIAIAVTIRPLAWSSAWRRACASRAGLSLALRQHVAMVDPDLDADGPKGRIRLGPRVVDVGAQGLQGHAALGLLLDTRDLRAAESATEDNLD